MPIILPYQVGPHQARPLQSLVDHGHRSVPGRSRVCVVRSPVWSLVAPPLDGVVGPSLVRGDWLTSRLTAGGADCIQVVGT
jgi:hypothetical protein